MQQRQRSILSYLQRPLSENQTLGSSSDVEVIHRPRLGQIPAKQSNSVFKKSSSVPMVKDASSDIRGTDTPPEKLPRQVLPKKFPAIDDNRPSLFSSIMHKFARVDEKEKSPVRNQAEDGSFNGCSTISRNEVSQGLSRQETPSRNTRLNTMSKFSNNYGEADPLHMESFLDTLGPDTPAMRPLVPRLKRIQEDCIGFKENTFTSSLDSSKRARLLQDSGTENKKHVEMSEAASSKFEWLNASSIRDANKRRPGDALYDKRTLYIPPDAMRKMSASQTQYWSVKCQYMDVLLFFKVGKFYELYELDAEIAHKELDWKITFSGVGKCRQVGISESGIDDAVQKLIARGYKVGRIEQLETSDQAKSRGKASVIQRKLVQVVTPSTTIDGNIGPDAVHLLALKEGNCGNENGSTVYGFAFVDCAALKFWVGSISDDASCAALGALLMQVSPKEVIYESRGLSKEAHKALKKYSSTDLLSLYSSQRSSGDQYIDSLLSPQS